MTKPFTYTAICAAALFTLAACEKKEAPSAPTAAASAAASVPVTAAPIAQAGPFVIRGETQGIEDGRKVTLGVRNYANPLSTETITVGEAVVKDGKFTIEGKVDAPINGALIYGEHTFAPILVEKGEFTAKLADDHYDVRGGDFHDKLYAYQRDPAYLKAVEAYQKGYAAAFKGVDENNEKQLEAARAKLDKLPNDAAAMQAKHFEQIARSDAPPLLRMFALLELDGADNLSAQERAAMLAEVEKQAGPQPAIAAERKIVEMNEKAMATKDSIQVGSPFVDLALKDADGKTHALAEVVGKNKLVLLDFWASWCGPCRGEFPHLRKVYDEFHSKGFEIYAVSADDDRAAWLKALKEENVPWINTADPGGMAGASLQSYGVVGLPSNYLIDAKGQIVGINMREWDVERAVKAAMSGKPIPQTKSNMPQ